MQDLLDRVSVEAAVQDPFGRLSVQGVYKRSPHKKRSQNKISVQTHCASSLYEISWLRDLLAKSRYTISTGALLPKRFTYRNVIRMAHVWS